MSIILNKDQILSSGPNRHSIVNEDVNPLERQISSVFEAIQTLSRETHAIAQEHKTSIERLSQQIQSLSLENQILTQQNIALNQQNLNLSQQIDSLSQNQTRYFQLIEQLLELNTFDYILKLTDQNLLDFALDKLLVQSSSIEDLFTSRFCVALEHDLITLTNYNQTKNGQSNNEFDFVNHENSTNSNLKTILIKHLKNDKYFKYCQYLNRLVFHIIIYHDKLKDLPSYSKSLSKENQHQILKLRQSVSQSVMTKYSLLSSFSKSSTDELLECLTFSLLDIKIDIPFIHFKNIIDKNSITEFKLLVKYSSNLDVHGDDNDDEKNVKNTPLIYAAIVGRLDCLSMLIQNKVNINFLGTNDNTALMEAARAGHSDCVLKLIENGANLELKSIFGNTALMIAAFNGRTNCLINLIDNNANIDTQCNDGNTSLMYAAHKGYFDCLLKLIENKVNIDIQSKYGWTALMFAALSGQLDCLLKLIEKGANLELTTNREGHTALIIAAQYCQTNCLIKLIDNKANIDTQDNDGWSALMYATFQGKQSCIDYLIRSGAKLDLKDSTGRTALDHARIQRK